MGKSARIPDPRMGTGRQDAPALALYGLRLHCFFRIASYNGGVLIVSRDTTVLTATAE